MIRFVCRLSLFKQAFVCSAIVLVFLFSAGCSRSPDELLESGKKYLAEHKYKGAAIELSNAIKINPRMVEAHYHLALALAGLGQLRDATQAISNTVKLKPDHFEAQLRYGYLLLLERKFDQAREKAQLILNREPANTWAQIL